MTLTHRTSIVGGPRSAHGYWELASAPGEKHLSRNDYLVGRRPVESRPLLTVAHLSDLHLCDSQSPARGEFLDRWSDPDSPLREVFGITGAYRAQDCLTVQVGAAMVRAVNNVRVGPVGGAPIDLAITTGDVMDSAQQNELGWYIDLLEGGRITPDSGSTARYEGVADHDRWDEAFWHPDPAQLPDDSPRPDRPRRLFGFPDAPGLLDALREPFDSPGLNMPWLAVHGNHDQLVQGTIPATGEFAVASVADLKAIGVPPHWTLEQVAQFCASIDAVDQAGLDRWSEMMTRPVTPDRSRRTIDRADFVAAHFRPTARPAGHGLPISDSSRCYYRHDHASRNGGDRTVTVLVLDTVDEHGGWQGSLDAPQLDWLESELASADTEKRYVVLASHHRLADLVNDRNAEGAPRRILTAELAERLEAHPCLVLWLNGHTHVTAVTGHGTTGNPNSWWEVTAPSLIDFPQQGRIVELLRSANGTLTVAVTMIDHTGEVPWSGGIDSVAAMAGLSRQLAANDWQYRPDDFAAHPLAGTAGDRNVLLHLPDPF
ncbi:metallophosphoesterase, PPA1498 family [Nakamurella panacisegetis]|uniref:Metallophosphoesterase, PPA1498 family n=1 Tax=Nakamurella panacisegetis TaxID=1090615 RepID=A0A1H0JW05_9ACTN|nr:TIGR03767 family metallophosphoesterase [Nakamurella panacisegetis]SDO47672.1 metallophosphoesterase, PPA1498 family [Nakamurella panacisegetis]